jgi:hypothetical protein
MLACLISRKPTVMKEIMNMTKYPVNTKAYFIKFKAGISLDIPMVGMRSNALRANPDRNVSAVIVASLRLAELGHGFPSDQSEAVIEASNLTLGVLTINTC